MSKVSCIESDRVRYPDQESEGPAMTKASGSKDTMKGGLIEGHTKKMMVQKAAFSIESGTYLSTSS